MEKTKELFYLIKFIDQRYINSFLEKGQIHYEPLYYFSELERKTGDRRIGDAFEGNACFNPINLPIFFLMKNKKGKVIKAVPFKNNNLRMVKGLPEKLKQRIGICSFFYVAAEDLEYFTGKDGNRYYKFNDRIISELVNFIKKDDRIPVMIHNIPEFAKRCEKQHSPLKPVYYYDESDFNNWDSITTNSPIFYSQLKRKVYSGQHEVRLLKILKELNEGENIEIGNIKTIARVLDRDGLCNDKYIFKC